MDIECGCQSGVIRSGTAIVAELIERSFQTFFHYHHLCITMSTTASPNEPLRRIILDYQPDTTGLEVWLTKGPSPDGEAISLNKLERDGHGCITKKRDNGGAAVFTQICAGEHPQIAVRLCCNGVESFSCSHYSYSPATSTCMCNICDTKQVLKLSKHPLR